MVLRFVRNVQSYLLLNLFWLYGCQGAGQKSSCAQTNAASGTGVARSKTPGGALLVMEGKSIAPGSENKRSIAQCSAFIRVMGKTGASYKSQIWTARHCLPDFSSRILLSDLWLFDGRNSYVKIDTQLPLAQARAAFFDLVESKIPEFQDAEKKQKHPARLVLDYTFLEEEGKKNYGEDCQNGQRGASLSETLLCAALQDFRIFDAQLTPKTRLGNELLTSLMTREAERARRNNNSSLGGQWQALVRNQTELELDISRGRFVDTVLQCKEASPSAACQFEDTLRQLAQKYRAPERDLLAEAQRDGFTSPGRSYSEFKRTLAQQHFTDKLLPVFTQLQSSLQSGALELIFAGNFADSSGKSRMFASAPLKDFFTSQGGGPSFSFATAPTRRDAYLKFESPVGKELVVAKGDSGSALMFDETTPFMVLSAKGKESISGGSSILAIPESTDDESIVSRPVITRCR